MMQNVSYSIIPISDIVIPVAGLIIPTKGIIIPMKVILIPIWQKVSALCHIEMPPTFILSKRPPYNAMAISQLYCMLSMLLMSAVVITPLRLTTMAIQGASV